MHKFDKLYNDYAVKYVSSSVFVESVLKKYENPVLIESITTTDTFMEELYLTGIMRCIDVGTEVFEVEYNLISEGILDKVKSWFGSKKEEEPVVKQQVDTTQSKLGHIKSAIFDWFKFAGDQLRNIRTDILAIYKDNEGKDAAYSAKHLPQDLYNAAKLSTARSPTVKNIGNFLDTIVAAMQTFDPNVSRENVESALQLELKSAFIGSRQSLGKTIAELISNALFSTKMFNDRMDNKEDMVSLFRHNNKMKATTVLAILMSISLLPQALKIMNKKDDTGIIKSYLEVILKYDDGEASLFRLHKF